jgi:hypothetical protein
MVLVKHRTGVPGAACAPAAADEKVQGKVVSTKAK